MKITKLVYLLLAVALFPFFGCSDGGGDSATGQPNYSTYLEAAGNNAIRVTIKGAKWTISSFSAMYKISFFNLLEWNKDTGSINQFDQMNSLFTLENDASVKIEFSKDTLTGSGTIELSSMGPLIYTYFMALTDVTSADLLKWTTNYASVPIDIQ